LGAAHTLPDATSSTTPLSVLTARPRMLLTSAEG
jgi:hypothetical protein